jgi:hypothetical protein
MQRSSPSIAALATALAKAQIELANPEKSLIGTIKTQAGEGGRRQFRYAPLSSGLEIVRKTLGQHEIAIVQTTAIDEAAGIVRLSTILAHASGEWIASDWPVCAISETSAPHRMGAALTYARRYALFTLVGIAGEDDLDAPDLASPIVPGTTPHATGNKKGCFDGGQGQSAQQFSSGRSVKATAKPPRAILESEASAVLRDRLIAELNDLNSAESAASWARRVLSAKNSLTANDADCVEQAFQSRLTMIVTQGAGGSLAHEAEPRRNCGCRGKKRRRAAVVNKSALVLPAPRRIRDRDHVKSLAKQPCLICGRQPADAHHLRFAQSRALGCKVSDEFTVPLCRGHHREAHRGGDEVAWWKKMGIDPLSAARTLWLETHQLQSAKVIQGVYS